MSQDFLKRLCPFLNLRSNFQHINMDDFLLTAPDSRFTVLLFDLNTESSRVSIGPATIIATGYRQGTYSEDPA